MDKDHDTSCTHSSLDSDDSQVSQAKSVSGGAIPKKKRVTTVADVSSDDSSSVSSQATSSTRKKRSTRKSTAAIFHSLPETLQYDGKGNWFTFKQKFLRYANACDWTSEECNDGLCWCLTGKAADYHAIQLERYGDLPFRKLLDKLESRLGRRELAETSQARFQQSAQMQEESLDDWADRVMALATKAFRDLPEHFSNRQAVSKFCEGLVDKEAGFTVAMSKPSTIEEAMSGIRWYQHLHQSAYGGTKKAGRGTANNNANVYAMQRGESEDEEANASPHQVSSLELAIEKLQRSLDNMVVKLEEKGPWRKL